MFIIIYKSLKFNLIEIEILAWICDTQHLVVDLSRVILLLMLIIG